MAISIKDVYARNGRVRTGKLIELIQSVPRHTFCSMISHPMLVSKTLYDGQLQQVGNSTNTMVFNVKALKEQITQTSRDLEDTISEMNEEDNFNSSIFALIKNPDSYSAEDVFTIGRVIPNDIVIPDFTISKKHASIRIIEDSYHCFDLGSTNGTLVAGKILQANESITLRPCEYITIGRLGFVFMPAEKLYDLLKR